MTLIGKKIISQIYNYKIILITGPQLSGKTTVKNKLIRLFKILSLGYEEISEINDLFLPFAIKNKYLPRKLFYRETEITNVIDLLNKKYGRKIGVILFENYLIKKPKNNIYIIEGNNIVNGIFELRKKIKKLLVVGVYPYFNERFCRLKPKKYFLNFKELKNIFKTKEKLFNINNAIKNCDVLIENHEKLPYEIEINILDALLKNGFTKLKLNLQITFPELSSKEKNSKYICPNKIKFLLKKIIVKNKNIFIVQGGNRYIFDYMSKKYKANIDSKKIICLNKVKLFIALNTLLTDKERNELLNKNYQAKIYENYLLFDPIVKECVDLNIINLGFSNMKEFLEYGSKSEILKVFTNINIKTPFSYGYVKENIKTEFDNIDFFLKKEELPIIKKEIIKYIFLDTDFYNKVYISKNKILFLDDVFYRGRTFYTLSYILNLLDVPKEKWSISTLCLNRDSDEINLEGKNITILDNKLLYKFENRVIGELGYWEESSSYFDFLNLNIYFNYLYYLNSNNKDIVLFKWNKIEKTILKKIGSRGINIAMAKILLKHFIHYKSFNLENDLEALLDQRAKLSGYCIPFVQYLTEYINVTEPGYKRKIFKLKIKQYIKKIEDFSQENKLYFYRLVNFYRKNHLILDYYYLKKICQK